MKSKPLIYKQFKDYLTRLTEEQLLEFSKDVQVMLLEESASKTAFYYMNMEYDGR